MARLSTSRPSLHSAHDVCCDACMIGLQQLARCSSRLVRRRRRRALTECGVTVEQAGTKHLAGGGLGSHQGGKAGRRAGGAEAAVSATQLWLLTPASSCRRKSLTSVPSRSRTSAQWRTKQCVATNPANSQDVTLQAALPSTSPSLLSPTSPAPIPEDTHLNFLRSCSFWKLRATLTGRYGADGSGHANGSRGASRPRRHMLFQ